jgi:hypothetical protein
LARRWVARGFQAIQEAKVVVTDRLHGHVFCVLAGIPHVVLDNNYHKVSSTLDTWSGNLPGVHRAESGEQAWEIARDLLAAGAESSKLRREEIFKTACKQAVKANRYLTNADISNLLSSLDNCDNASTCPHGRPIAIKLTFAEIRKRFLR